MGLGSWAKKHLAVRLDGHTWANLTKNAAPVAGAALGGPLGLALAGGLGAAGELGRGKNIGEAAKAGLSSAGQAGIGMAAKGGLAKLAGGGGNAVQTGASAARDVAFAPADFAPASVLESAAPAAASHGLLYNAGSSALNAGGRVLDFAEKHPNATAGALSAFGGLEARDAETDLLRQRAEETRFDFDRRKRRQTDLAGAFGGVSALNPVGASPYGPRTG